MKIVKQIFIFCMGFFILAHANNEETQYKPEQISILLEQDITEALLEVKGAYYIYNPYDGSKVSSGILGKRFIVRPTAYGIKWGQEYVGVHQIVIVPRSKDASFILNGIQYTGSIAIYKINDELSLINILDVEDYLKSTLSTKFEFPLEPEAMAAVSIAARTTAYFQINKNKDSFWHIDAKKENYQGKAVIIPNSPIVKAIDSTENLILLNRNDFINVPFLATWHEHSGGQTIASHHIFRKEYDAPKKGVAAPLAKLNRNDTRWTYTISKDRFAKLFDLSKISKIDLYQEKESKKVYAIRVKDGERNVDINFIRMQNTIGRNFLKSNDFTLVVRDHEIHFIGYGKGDSTGLCLYSASAMAQKGEMAISILSKFYPDTFIYNLNSSYPTNSSVE